MDDQNYQLKKKKSQEHPNKNCVNKNGNNIALPNIYPQITLNPKPTHSKKYCFSSFK